MKNKISYPEFNIDSAAKSWWRGDNRVEEFMFPVSEALERNKIKGNVKTDIYNRCYEAVYNAIIKYEKPSS